jgi:DnaJ-class molecular chaperone
MRNKTITPEMVHTAAQVLGVLQEFREHAQAPDYSTAKDRFDSMKIKAEASYKRLARKYHPDLGGSVEKMQELNDARDLLKAIRFVAPQHRAPINPPMHARPVAVRVVVTGGFGFGGTSTTTQSTSTFTWFSGDGKVRSGSGGF